MDRPPPHPQPPHERPTEDHGRRRQHRQGRNLLLKLVRAVSRGAAWLLGRLRRPRLLAARLPTRVNARRLLAATAATFAQLPPPPPALPPAPAPAVATTPAEVSGVLLGRVLPHFAEEELLPQQQQPSPLPPSPLPLPPSLVNAAAEADLPLSGPPAGQPTTHGRCTAASEAALAGERNANREAPAGGSEVLAAGHDAAYAVELAHHSPAKRQRWERTDGVAAAAAMTMAAATAAVMIAAPDVTVAVDSAALPGRTAEIGGATDEAAAAASVIVTSSQESQQAVHPVPEARLEAAASVSCRVLTPGTGDAVAVAAAAVAPGGAAGPNAVVTCAAAAAVPAPAGAASQVPMAAAAAAAAGGDLTAAVAASQALIAAAVRYPHPSAPMPQPHGNSMVFDTETTGLPSFERPETHEPYLLARYEGCRIVSIGWRVLGPPPGLATLRRGYHIVRPGYDFESSLKALETHHITRQRALAEGRPLEDVLEEFLRDMQDCEAVVAHNAQFDLGVVLSELFRLGRYDDVCAFVAPRHAPHRHRRPVCTLLASRVALRGQLQEFRLGVVFQHLTGRVLEAAHKAEADTDACADVYVALLRLPVPPPPQGQQQQQVWAQPQQPQWQQQCQWQQQQWQQQRQWQQQQRWPPGNADAASAAAAAMAGAAATVRHRPMGHSLQAFAAQPPQPPRPPPLAGQRPCSLTAPTVSAAAGAAAAAAVSASSAAMEAARVKPDASMPLPVPCGRSLVLHCGTTGGPGFVAGSPHITAEYERCRLVSIAWRLLGPPPGLATLARGHHILHPPEEEDGGEEGNGGAAASGCGADMRAQQLGEALDRLLYHIENCEVILMYDAPLTLGVVLSELFRLHRHDDVRRLTTRGARPVCVMRGACAALRLDRWLRLGAMLAAVTGEGEAEGPGVKEPRDAAAAVDAVASIFAELLGLELPPTPPPPGKGKGC